MNWKTSAKETLNLSGQFIFNVPKMMRFGVSTGLREDIIGTTRLIIWIYLFSRWHILFRWQTVGFYTSKKKTNKVMHIPFCSLHQRYTIKNFVQGWLGRYLRYNMEEKNFIKFKTRFYMKFHNCVFRKYVLTKLFQSVTYAQRNKL